MKEIIVSLKVFVDVRTTTLPLPDLIAFKRTSLDVVRMS